MSEAKLRELYAKADALFEGWSCPSSTDCCRFGITRREPYVTSVELAYVVRAARAKNVKIARVAPREAPRTHRLKLSTAERPCPLLTADGRCSVYEARPFGCRTFFCDKATPFGKVPHRSMLALVDELKELAREHEPGGETGRPISRLLA